MHSTTRPKKWMAFFAVLLFSACVSKKETTSTNTSVLEEGKVRGVVTTSFKEQGCPLLIAIDGQGETRYLIPVQLPQTFQQDGLEIAFVYRTSRIAQGACQMGQPAVIEHVRRTFN